MKNSGFITILALLLSIMTVLSSCVLPWKPTPTPPVIDDDTGLLEGDLIISDETAVMTLGDVFTPKVMIGEEVLNCNWSSSNESIATVQGNGNILAHNLGNTTITAKYGTRTISCEITVVLNDNLPVLSLDSVSEDSVQIDMLHSLSLEGRVIFNGKEYDDVELSYELADPSFGTIDDGVFTPSKVGETTITVNASWRGIESYLLTKTISVKIIDSAVLLINNSPSLADIKLYTVDEFDGVAYVSEKPFEAKVVTANSNFDAQVSVLDTEVVRYDADSKKILAVGAGKTSIVVSYQEGDISIKYSIDVSVDSPIAKYDKKIVGFSALDGDLIDEDGYNVLEGLFSGENALYSAMQDGNALDVSTGKVLGVATSHEGLTKTTITVVGKQFGYTFDVEGYTKIIDEAKDFNVFDITTGNTVIRGYFIVTKDIDFLTDSEGFNEYCNTSGWDNSLSSSWFGGIFDGNGHTINGYPMTEKTGGGTNSMFGRVEDATIKNVAFTNVQTKSYGSRLFAQRMGLSFKTTVSNVYISFDIGSMDSKLFARESNLSIFGDGEHNLVLQDVIIALNASSNVVVTSSAGVGFFRGNTNGKTATYNNVYLIAPPADNGRILPVVQTDSLSIYAKNDFEAFGLKDSSRILFDNDLNPIEDTMKLNNHRITLCDVMRYDSFNKLHESGVASVGSWDISSGTPVWNAS